jgi:hypothetical protein
VAGKTAEIDHFSVLGDNFDAPAAVTTVKSLGASGAVLSRQRTFNEFFDSEASASRLPFRTVLRSYFGHEVVPVISPENCLVEAQPGVQVHFLICRRLRHHQVLIAR